MLQADGGTRTAAVTGGFVALCLAVDKLMRDGVLADSPVVGQVAAVSAGIVGGECALDLDYSQDSRAEADMNVVMELREGKLGFVEVQGTGEKRAYSREELDKLLALAEKGVAELMRAQLEALGDAAGVIGKKPKLVIASNNFGKIKELRQLLRDRFDVVSMREMGVTSDAEETGETFEENARIKAEALMQLTGCAALADDSGLIVDHLNGRPGVHSARYAGVHGDDEANNRLLLKDLEGVPHPRTARFACAIALVRPGRAPLTAFGTCEGEILDAPLGEGGFGYDPLFFSPELRATFAEADADAKNRVSHRARAIAQLLALLEAQDG
ncbi:MAG: Non-canonical purine NTP pyrophosphatase [Firmicutes bacterium ADurb.Bin467]|nr:MAG: Non-canonical purine NTP pyrophosphatase [Firmicutes bacterium ADurb.Bin467]